MKKINFIILSLLLPIGLMGQNMYLPQTFTPNAAELGKYGKIPVSYYSGLPNIQIPLTELRAKNYSLPVYLTYHAAGNKPEQHPGWVGLGWALHAGGCINRIIHGLKDEMGSIEYYHLTSGVWNISMDPGYYYRSTYTQSMDWEQEGVLEGRFKTINENIPYALADYAPDEFQINIDDIRASFYITGDGKVAIISREASDFTVDINIDTSEDQVMNQNGTLNLYYDEGTDLSMKVKLFHYINQIIVTKSDGTRYYFGGDQSSIEFSIIQMSASNQSWDARGIANTWMLTGIERPDGEVISLTYEHDGVPIVRHHAHSVENCYPSRGSIDEKDTFKYPSIYPPFSYSFLMPCYLKRVSSQIAQDYLIFSRETSVELTDSYREDEFLQSIGNHYQGYSGTDVFSPSYMWERNIYKRLSLITGKDGKRVVFNYSNEPTQRLHLGSVTITSSTESCPAEYSMNYDPIRLPAYGAKMVDAWGYYNGMVFGQTPQDTVNINYNRTLIDGILLHAEMLTKLTYPTGGYSAFEYEPHTFSQYVGQFPFELKDDASGYAGGLRIKKIKDYDGNHYEVRSFSYTENGRSSGILSGAPKFRVTGRFFTHISQDTLQPHVYEIYMEDPLYQLSTTDGNHVTYSYVKETRADGSWTERRYTNHDTPGCLDSLPVKTYDNAEGTSLRDAFVSKSLRRGLLCSQKDFSSNGLLVGEETYSYSCDESEFVKSVVRDAHFSGRMERFSYTKEFSYYPKLCSKTKRIRTDTGDYITETETYQYDSHRNPVKIQRRRGNRSEVIKQYYPMDMDYFPYTEMVTRDINALPVERIREVDGFIVEADLRTYCKNQSNGDYTISKWYHIKYPNGRDTSEFNHYVGHPLLTNCSYFDVRPELSILKYDSHSNLIMALTKDGKYLCYCWDSTGMYLEMILSGAQDTDVLHVDFENTFSNLASGFNSPKGHVGGYIVSLPNRNTSKDYILDYWKRESGGAWQYERTEYTGDIVIGGQNVIIDEVRVYPADALVQSYTYDTYRGLLLSESDSRGITKRYEYDGQGRLVRVYDNNGDKVKEYVYHFAERLNNE